MDEIILAQSNIRQAIVKLKQLWALSNPLVREAERKNFIESIDMIQNHLTDADTDLQNFVDRNSPESDRQ